MHADRTNRFVLTLFGVLVLLAGAAAMTASVGGFGTAFARRALFDNRVSAYIGQHATWVWAAAAFICLLIALAAVRWIAALLISTDRAGDITVPGSEDQGTTKLQPGALTGALTREVGTYHGVDAARGRVIGDASNPEIVLSVTAAQTADLPALHHRLETEALAHARQALGDPDLPIQLDLDVSRRHP
ncbi:MAG TPA: hypothetical protein VLW50_12650 [Streptosporangiaceae bacterium]|nr:hypothetical protein [Streptosporangiaceae bacterium]